MRCRARSRSRPSSKGRTQQLKKEIGEEIRGQTDRTVQYRAEVGAAAATATHREHGSDQTTALETEMVDGSIFQMDDGDNCELFNESVASLMSHQVSEVIDDGFSI